MASLTLILTLLLLYLHALFVDATIVRRLEASPISLPLARRVNLTSIHNLVKHDESRVKALRSRLQKASKNAGIFVVPNIPVTNQAITYTVNVTIGNPGHLFSLIIDTGSSNTWAGAQLFNSYKMTSTTKFTGDVVQVTYGSGSVLGVEAHDTMDLAPGLNLPNQSLGMALVSEGFTGVDGILGIGPTDLTVGTLIPSTTASIPTVTDNLFTEGIIPEREVAVYFQPADGLSTVNGEMTFGGINYARNTSEFTWVPITGTSIANKYWGIDQSISYGDNVILTSTAGIVDTGTTLIYIASDAYDAYMQLTGGTVSNTTGLLSLPVGQYANLQSLFFNIGGTSFELTPNAQIWPRSLNADIGGTADFVYLVVSSIGTITGSGLDFINGYTFLERFYSVYDSTNRRVGLAPTNYTNADTN
ncbi:hypothetical protein CVT26_013337 [Gymnopilus dilepis]|uniref:Peptidase A1 domain-containing protein n=1 Tax=Gymnopilus dilepis TaxID=231916 RepID=A0A409YF00_9AGAR|nr:hypothetical protein CVT26_013337 [Gymnopilus dilepis]